MAKYRTRNYIASENRPSETVRLHPAILDGLEAIAKREKKTVGWVVEEALSDHFGIKVLLRKLKGKALPAYGGHLKIVRRRA